mmetsp:Transcript_101996/g.287952  ORF Transcript_101996/g.287952 Transcript_101996/m.287952 type:complete len:234 (+) Transcript_101996:100-801(+)
MSQKRAPSLTPLLDTIFPTLCCRQRVSRYAPRCLRTSPTSFPTQPQPLRQPSFPRRDAPRRNAVWRTRGLKVEAPISRACKISRNSKFHSGLRARSRSRSPSSSHSRSTERPSWWSRLGRAPLRAQRISPWKAKQSIFRCVTTCRSPAAAGLSHTTWRSRGRPPRSFLGHWRSTSRLLPSRYRKAHGSRCSLAKALPATCCPTPKAHSRAPAEPHVWSSSFGEDCTRACCFVG